MLCWLLYRRYLMFTWITAEFLPSTAEFLPSTAEFYSCFSRLFRSLFQSVSSPFFPHTQLFWIISPCLTFQFNHFLLKIAFFLHSLAGSVSNNAPIRRAVVRKASFIGTTFYAICFFCNTFILIEAANTIWENGLFAEILVIYSV